VPSDQFLTCLPRGGWTLRDRPLIVDAEGQTFLSHSAIQVVFRPVYLSRACSERSRPNPDCLNPPNGVCALSASTVS
jgi:hypothetical protein